MVPSSGPLFPAAHTTTIPRSHTASRSPINSAIRSPVPSCPIPTDIFNEVQVAFNGYRTEVTKIMQEEQEKKETKEITVPIEYTEEEIEAMKKKE